MKVTQIYDIVNSATSQILGEETVLQEDLSNIVDIGKEVIGKGEVDNYVKSLVNKVGKVIFTDRLYKGSSPSILMDKWEYGSIVEKISSELPTATESDTWKLQDGKDYNPDIFYQPKVTAKFFNSRTTFEIPLSFTELQVKESFNNATQLNGFISMLYTSVENAMTVKIDGLIMSTIANMVGETLKDVDTGTGNIRAVNLLTKYNEEFNQNLTVTEALTDKEFIRFSTYIIGIYTDRLQRISTLFNQEGKERFTPKEDIHVVLLSDFAKSSDVFMKTEYDNENYLNLPTHETVSYWQGSGEEYAFEDISRINVKTSSNQEIDVTGILGVMFDRQALGVTNLDRRVTTNYNPKAEFYTNFYKFDAGFFNDLNENFIVFYVAEAGAGTESGAGSEA